MNAIKAIAIFLVALMAGNEAFAADKVRLVISTRGGWELFAPEEAEHKGFFKEEGLDVTVIYGEGGTASVQAVASGTAEVIIGTGTMGVMAANAKGAPIKIIANGRRGVGEVFWYVPVASPIKSLKDLKGKTLAYSAPGSTTFLIANFMIKEHNLDAKMVAVGSMAPSRTQVMSGQIDTGWSAAPMNLDLARKGEIRIIATGDDVKALADYSIRCSAANADWLAKNRQTAIKFQRAYWKGIESLYKDPEAANRFAEKWKLDPADAKRAGEFTPIRDVNYSPLGKMAEMEKLAIEYNMLKEPMTAEQKKNLVDIVWDPGPVK